MDPVAFPVRAPRVDYSSAFSAGHKGVDIFAAEGSPVVAMAAGHATSTEGPVQGLGVRVTETDGTRYHYAHLSKRVGTFPRNVEAGEVIGAVGTTGNATGKTPHLHLEIRPQGGEQVDPVQVLDALPGNVWSRPIPGGLLAPESPRPSAPKSSSVRSKSSNNELIALALLAWEFSKEG